MEKIIFFDIDGTLWDAKKYIPDSTKLAIKQLKENGHLVFICSGRTRCFIPKEGLLEMNFDGLVCGCGTHIEKDGQDLLYKKLDNDLVERTVKLLDELDIPVILEGKDCLYYDSKSVSDAVYGKVISDGMKDMDVPTDMLTGNKEKWECSKYSVSIEGKDYNELIEQFKNEYEFLIHGNESIEILPKGYSKGTGITYLCRVLGIDIKDTYAFGDSVNDLDMLRTAGTGISMGNGTKAAKEAADYVTDSIYEDGIYNACKHFGLI